MFKADTGLTVPTALTKIRYLADFVLSTLMLKKLTEIAFCVTKNRFFLIRFLICVNRTTVRRCPLSRRELDHYIILSYAASSIFDRFFAFFSDFFLRCSFAAARRDLPSDSLLILSHRMGKVNCFSHFFYIFFGKIWHNFYATMYCVFPFVMLQ